jgi:heme/copper-type cytochrome/quinol oxidase subunit 4
MKRYLIAFAALLALTAANVALSQAPLSAGVRVGAVLAVSGIEAVVAALAFMHLDHERRWVYGTVVLTIVVLSGLLFWPAWDIYERVRL